MTVEHSRDGQTCSNCGETVVAGKYALTVGGHVFCSKTKCYYAQWDQYAGRRKPDVPGTEETGLQE